MKRTDATPSSSTVVKKLESHGHCVLYVWYCGIGIKERALELGGALKAVGATSTSRVDAPSCNIPCPAGPAGGGVAAGSALMLGLYF